MIALIAAFTKSGRVLGKNGKIPWNIPEERARFKFLTTGNAVVMGKKTFEEIGHPLINRLNIIVSSTKNFYADNCITVRSLSEALETANNKNFEKIFIAGGSGLYKESLPLADILYLTEINTEYEGDVFFPQFDKTKFTVVIEESNEQFTHFTYRRTDNFAAKCRTIEYSTHE